MLGVCCGQCSCRPCICKAMIWQSIIIHRRCRMSCIMCRVQCVCSEADRAQCHKCHCVHYSSPNAGWRLGQDCWSDSESAYFRMLLPLDTLDWMAECLSSELTSQVPATLCCIEASTLRCPSVVRCEVDFSPTVISCNALLVVYSHASVRLAGCAAGHQFDACLPRSLSSRPPPRGGERGASTGGPAKGQSWACTWLDLATERGPRTP